MSERDRISAAIAATRGMSDAAVQRAIFEAMRVGRNRWAAFSDDELGDLMDAIESGDWSSGIAGDVSDEGWLRGLHPQQREGRVAPEQDAKTRAEIERRRSE